MVTPSEPKIVINYKIHLAIRQRTDQHKCVPFNFQLLNFFNDHIIHLTNLEVLAEVRQSLLCVLVCMDVCPSVCTLAQLNENLRMQ